MRIEEQLMRDEGLRLEAYPDPLTGGEPWTIGYGHTGGVRKGDVISKMDAYQYLCADIDDAEDDLKDYLPWCADLDDARYGVLLNMCFNLGIKRLLKFKNTLALIKAGDYEGASAAMMNSLWAKQVGQRAKRLARQMLTGVWQ